MAWRSVAKTHRCLPQENHLAQFGPTLSGTSTLSGTCVLATQPLFHLVRACYPTFFLPKYHPQECQLRFAANLANGSMTTGANVPYDALLDLYEPGTTTAELDAIFSDVKSWLPDLIEKALARQASQNKPTSEENNKPTVTKSFADLQLQFPERVLAKLGKEFMTLLKFDFEHGRLDTSAHPFCGGVPSDVRMTTRWDSDDFWMGLLGVVHETGHARYEQGLPKEFSGLPGGSARSMGVHESQSLFLEMQLARSFEFCELVVPMLREAFLDDKQGLANENDRALLAKHLTPQTLYRVATRVERSFIRVDADELTYPAHVLVRYEIERDLMEGRMKVEDLPERWNEKMVQYLGLPT